MMTNSSWTEPQRKLLFILLNKEGKTKEEIESALTFPLSELHVREAGLLIDCLKNNGDLPATMKHVREMHTETHYTTEISGGNEGTETQPNTMPKSREEAEARKKANTEKSTTEGNHTASQPIALDWSVSQTNPEQYVRQLNHLYLHLLQKDTDYGVIPGTYKPTLYKAGGELLALHLRLTTSSTDTTEYREVFGIPVIISRVQTDVFFKGEKIGDGRGSCSSAETKYAFRWVPEKKLPKGIDKDSLYSEEGQYGRRYKVPSTVYEVFDVANTILKIAEKRAFVDAILKVTGASRIFTQDLEDINREDVK